jgi:hypothetical protein
VLHWCQPILIGWPRCAPAQSFPFPKTSFLSLLLRPPLRPALTARPGSAAPLDRQAPPDRSLRGRKLLHGRRACRQILLERLLEGRLPRPPPGVGPHGDALDQSRFLKNELSRIKIGVCVAPYQLITIGWRGRAPRVTERSRSPRSSRDRYGRVALPARAPRRSQSLPSMTLTARAMNSAESRCGLLGRTRWSEGGRDRVERRAGMTENGSEGRDRARTRRVRDWRAAK